MDYNFKFDEITDEEFQSKMGKYFTGMENLYNIMPTLTYEEYRKKFKEVFSIIHNLGQHIVMPNTSRIETREFEVFGKHWYEDFFKPSSDTTQ